MNAALESSEFTPRARLELEFAAPVLRGTRRAESELGQLTVQLHTVAAALAGAPRVHRDLNIAMVISDALDRDIDAASADLRMLKMDESRHALASHVIDVALDPQTWETAARDVGPRPDVSVRLLIPGGPAARTQPLRDVDVAIIYRGARPAAADLDRLVETLTPDVAIPAPAIVLQARRNAEARSALLTEFGALTAAQVAELSGSDAKNRSALAGRWRRERRVFAVEHHGTTYYPAFQFDAHGRPRPVVAEVLACFERLPAWEQALWFTGANGWLDGRRPVDLLETAPGAVAAAAREAVREPVG